MKRDRRLQALSSDHHSALTLARSIVAHAGEPDSQAALAAELQARFEGELAPHFRIEEEVLLPGLLAVGEVALVQRTTDDHAALRKLVAEIARGDFARMPELASLLVAHVRFEERELFPCCEQRLPDALLEEALRRATS